MKSLEDLHLLLLAEASRNTGIDTSLDIKLFESRLKNEGMSFCTISLPAYTKSLYVAMDRGRIVPEDFPSFGKNHHLPRFLHGFMERIFDSNTGELLDDPDIYCVRAVIQITGVLSKVELPCPPERVEAALNGYIETDVDVRVWEAGVRERTDLLREFRQTANSLFGDVFRITQELLLSDDFVPAHGPGATAERTRNNARWKQRSWPARLEDIFPMWRYAFSSARYYLDALDAGEITEPGTELPVRIVDVPKTQKTPRIIAIEPTCMQYLQQGIRRCFESAIKRDKLVSRMITLNDQTPNQRLALLGTLGHLPIVGRWTAESVATLDLSEASDRVSNLLVKTMLLDYPELNRAIQACRSTHASVPGMEDPVPLAKFASMGSALTFVVETIVFTVIVSMAVRRDLHRELGPTTPVLQKRFYRALEWVHVYGDDIVVPTHHAAATVRLLEDFGLKVNKHKSFTGSNFRESCGKEYFRGFDVTYAKLRQPLPHRLQPETDYAKSIASLVAFHNLLVERDWFETADTLATYIEGFIPFPYVSASSPVLGRQGLSNEYDIHRFDPNLQRPQVRGAVLVERKRKDPLGGDGALNKFFFNRLIGDEPIYDPNHLLQAGRPVSLRIRTRYGNSY